MVYVTMVSLRGDTIPFKMLSLEFFVCFCFMTYFIFNYVCWRRAYADETKCWISLKLGLQVVVSHRVWVLGTELWSTMHS